MGIYQNLKQHGLTQTEQILLQGGLRLQPAVVFDRQGCGLACFGVNHHDPGLCSQGVDCLGLYKVQKGFEGFVENLGLEVRMMYRAEPEELFLGLGAGLQLWFRVQHLSYRAQQLILAKRLVDKGLGSQGHG